MADFETPIQVFTLWARLLKLDAEKARNINGRFSFCIKGKAGIKFTVQCDSGKVSIEQGFNTNYCQLELSDSDFILLAKGLLNPQDAFVSGRIKLAGETSEALKLNSLFSIVLANDSHHLHYTRH